MTKVYTRPIRERFGEQHGITGATMEDGTVYKSGRDGGMNVDPSHAAAMKRDPRVADNIVLENFVPKGVPGRECIPCHRSLWAWQTECPKCGATTQETK